MWANVTIAFFVLGVVSAIATEFARSIMNHRRIQQRGVGGTQDIAICGLLIMVVCILGTVVSGVMCWMGY